MWASSNYHLVSAKTCKKNINQSITTLTSLFYSSLLALVLWNSNSVIIVVVWSMPISEVAIQLKFLINWLRLWSDCHRFESFFFDSGKPDSYLPLGFYEQAIDCIINIAKLELKLNYKAEVIVLILLPDFIKALILSH